MTILQYMNETGLLFWKSLPISLLIGLAEWAALLFYARGSGGEEFLEKRSLCLHGALLLCCLFLQFQHYNVLAHCVILLLFTTVYLCLFTRCSWFNGVFQGCVFCLYLELGKSVCRDGLLACGLARLFPGIGTLTLNLTLFGLYLLYLALLCGHFSRHRHRPLDLPMTTVQAVELLFPFLLYLLVRASQYELVAQLDNLQWLRFDLLQYAVAMCALLVMRTIGNLLSSQVERSELLHRQLLAEQKQQQYQVQRESIEFVNRRYHDLRHYLTGIEAILAQAEEGSQADWKQAGEFVRTLKQEIDPYGSIQRTGSPVMDVLLSQRFQECQSKGIRLLPYIDATQTACMSTLDLCALFGNAMDNAVEAVDALDDPERREIHVKIGTSDGLLLMRFSNPFEGERRRKNQGFLTTKQDAFAHGYGLTNIAAIAEKYGGTISTDCGGNEFTLHVLIPLPDTKERTPQ